MTIIFTDLSGMEILTLPIEPIDFKIKLLAKNETLSTLGGEVRLIGVQQLKSYSWSSTFPVNKNYDFVNPGAEKDGHLYVDFIDNMQSFELPIKIIRTNSEKKALINTLVSIDSFEWNYDQSGDILYSVTLTEFSSNIWTVLNPSNKTANYLKDLILKAIKRKVLKKAGLL